MENTLDSIVFAVLDTVKPENQVNTNVTEELVQYHINNVRAQLAKQSYDKNGYLDNAYIQSLGCISLVEADPSECCAYPTGCIILRTSVAIPRPIESNGNLITRVGPVNLTEKSFQRINFERVPFEGLNKYTRSLKKWFTIGNSGYIYILVSKGDLLANSLEVINVQGALENPSEAINFTNCSTGTACYASNKPYPVPNSLIPTIIEMVIKKFIAIQAVAPIDKSNDSATNPEQILTK